MLFKILSLLAAGAAFYFMIRKSGLLGGPKKDAQVEQKDEGPQKQVATLKECPECGAFYDPEAGPACSACRRN